MLIEAEPLPPKPLPAQLAEPCPGFAPTGMTPEAWTTIRELSVTGQVEFILGYVKDQWATAYVECQSRHAGIVEWAGERE